MIIFHYPKINNSNGYFVPFLFSQYFFTSSLHKKVRDIPINICDNGKNKKKFSLQFWLSGLKAIFLFSDLMSLAGIRIFCLLKFYNNFTPPLFIFIINDQ